ncbi:hypothetical protein GH714_036366 [Hevea brasiliensis]|uniref:SBP-type domain-containing protein n=1 Tax=Hevea brasiliensis TaxID=3981 RepID=A0A6A6KKH2_HEVBR|nr:hypothetical protein GH714_036366 [Hevea brasiliensis]
MGKARPNSKRFHQLPEFDQGKRSCRRRLAGHNERRRKPPTGSVLSSRYNRLFQQFLITAAELGAFLWISVLTRGLVGGMHGRLQDPVNGFTSGTGFSNSVIPSGECYTGVSIADSSCALSLLSNQQWGPRNQASGLGVKDMVNNPQGASMAQSTAPHCAIVNQYPNHTWCFKGSEASSSSHQMCHDLCLGQISQPLNSQFSGDLDLSQQNTKQYMELDHSRAYDSSAQHMHWSL